MIVIGAGEDQQPRHTVDDKAYQDENPGAQVSFPIPGHAPGRRRQQQSPRPAQQCASNGRLRLIGQVGGQIQRAVGRAKLDDRQHSGDRP